MGNTAGTSITDGGAVPTLSSLGGAPLASPTFTGTVSGITATMVGLGNVTNNAQTQAAVVPNTAPAAGQDLVGNAGGTAYAPVTMSGDCTRSSTGAITCTKSNGTALGTGAFATIANYAPLASPTFTGTVSGITATMVGLGNVTNNAQTQAAIVPNTAPAAGQDLVGNAGGTAYAPVTMSGDCTRSSTGAITCTKSNGTALGPLATESIATTGQGGLGVNNSSATGVPVFASGTSTVTAQVGISGGSPVKATNTYNCIDGYDHTPCVVWKPSTLTGLTYNGAGNEAFVPAIAGMYRVTGTTCVTTTGTAGTVNPLLLLLWGNVGGSNVNFTSPVGSCSSVQTSARIPAAGTTYQISIYSGISGNVGGVASMDAFAEYMGP
jgi:hypothetical protein